MHKEVVYKAIITTTNNKYYNINTSLNLVIYIAKHNHSFNIHLLKSSTNLSKLTWKLKSRRIPYEVIWEMIRKATSNEKLFQSLKSWHRLINNRVELAIISPKNINYLRIV